MKVTGTAPATFVDTALTLHAQGWRPIPLVADTKQPAEPGWQSRCTSPWPDSELAQVVRYHGHCACGLAVQPEAMALDCDITDPDRAGTAAKLADEHLGKTPLVRIGMAPKWVRLYRTTEPLRSIKPHPLEVYCGSGQVVAFGHHAKAGRPYLWPEANPLDLRADAADIPAVSAPSLRRFLTACKPLLADLRQARRQGGGGIGLDPGARLRTLMRRGMSFHRAAGIVLRGAADGGRHYAVRAVISAGFNHGLDADAIHALLRHRCPQELWELVTDDGYLDRTINDFAPRFSAWRDARP